MATSTSMDPSTETAYFSSLERGSAERQAFPLGSESQPDLPRHEDIMEEHGVEKKEEEEDEGKDEGLREEEREEVARKRMKARDSLKRDSLELEEIGDDNDDDITKGSEEEEQMDDKKKEEERTEEVREKQKESLKGVSSRSLASQSRNTASNLSRSNLADDSDPSVRVILVDWDSPTDPANPQNWTQRKKWSLVFPLSLMTLVTPLASSMFAPGVPILVEDFHQTSTLLAGFVVSVYLLGFVAGPLIVAPASELWGRRITYHISNFFFIVFTVACAVAPSFESLIGFRFLAGCAGSTPVTIGGGTLADLFPTEERGKAMALWTVGPLLGPVIGPIAGGFLTEAEGWRWVFWVLAIAHGVVSLGCLFAIKETYAPTLLGWKANRLQKEWNKRGLEGASVMEERGAEASEEEKGENKSLNEKDDLEAAQAESKHASPTDLPRSAQTQKTSFRKKVIYRSILDRGLSGRKLFWLSIVRPLKLLFKSMIVLLFATFMAVVYGYLYLLFTTFPNVFQKTYGFTSGTVGLTYIGIGMGMGMGMVVFGICSDRYLKQKVAQGKKLKPEYRLPLMVPGALCIPIGLFWYGWSAEAKVHWIVPIIGTWWVGVGLLAIFMPVQTYVVDAFPLYASSAMAAITVLRSVVGAILPLAGESMYDALGYGWGNSLLGFIALGFIPIPIIFVKYGEKIRNMKRFQVNL